MGDFLYFALFIVEVCLSLAIVCGIVFLVVILFAFAYDKTKDIIFKVKEKRNRSNYLELKDSYSYLENEYKDLKDKCECLRKFKMKHDGKDVYVIRSDKDNNTYDMVTCSVCNKIYLVGVRNGFGDWILTDEKSICPECAKMYNEIKENALNTLIEKYRDSDE